MATYANLKSKISLDSTEFKSGIRRVKLTAGAASKSIGRGFKSMGAGLGKVASRLAGLLKSMVKFAAVAGAITFAAAIAGAAKLATGLKKAFDVGGALSDLSSRTGIAVKDLVVLEQAFKDNGIAAEKVGPIINKMQKGITDFGSGLSTQVRAFERLGIAFEDIVDKSPAEQLDMIQKGLKNVDNQAIRTGTAMEIFGRAGGELQTLFDDDGALAKAAVTIGAQADILDKNSAKFDRISDLLASAGVKIQGFFVGMADIAAPKILAVLERFNTIDFAAIGQRFAVAFNPSNMASSIQKLGDLMASVMSDAMQVAMEFGYATLRGLLSAEGLSFLGDSIMGIFTNLGDSLANVFLDVFDKIRDWKMSKDNAQFGEMTNGPEGGTDPDKAGGAEGFIARMRKELGGVDIGMSDKTKKILKDISSSVPRKSESDLYDAERAADVARNAADGAAAKAAANQSGTSAMHGPPAPFQEIGPQVDRNFLAQRDINDTKKAGFKGLAGLSQMQLDKSMGIGPGVSSKLGARSGNSGAIGRNNLNGVSGGLGATRRVGQAKDEKAAKKADTLATTNEYLTTQNDLILEQNALLREGLQ